LAKKYIEGESKQQRKARKAKEKALKSAKAQKTVVSTDLFPQNSVEPNNFVLCIKHGTKYSYDYVNRLYNMVSRNCTLDYQFVCLTDNNLGLDPNIRVLPIPNGLEGWWCKPYMYSNDLPLNGTILYMDLDVVISGNIDKLFTYKPDRWAVIRDFSRAMRPTWQKYNSSVIRFRTGELDRVWKNFISDKVTVQRRNFGDQDFLYTETHNTYPANLFPDAWIRSWKWEIRKTKDFKPGQTRGNRTFARTENVKPGPDCCIAVFHGDPNPHNCDDPWVVENWK